jgi:16S rRNA (adenine1518-N6/adenine1519-N6)-dimethyltransferase
MVTPKKHLGQHFLTDLNIARKIVEQLSETPEQRPVLEVGPGMGVLTDYLLDRKDIALTLVDIDRESIHYLTDKYPRLEGHIISADFLKMPLAQQFSGGVDIIGNFPYNISSQIFFKVLDNRNLVKEVVGMIQKEVAERLAEPPGSKTYGILSVLLQAFYKIEYCFTVSEHVFNPKPKVKSAVIKLVRNEVEKLNCDEKLFFQVVKQGFNQRRKTLRNALRSLIPVADLASSPYFDKRAEQLSVPDFISLTNHLEQLSRQQ